MSNYSHLVGKRVFVLPGALCRSTYTPLDRSVAQRRRPVTIDHLRGESRDQVTWTTGDYWIWTDAKNVEPIDEEAYHCCADCGTKIALIYGRCHPCSAKVRSGEGHHFWAGDAVSRESARIRAVKGHSLEGVTCEHEGCERPATDRHHIDGETRNNDRSNLAFLCRRHHMLADGRAAALGETGRQNAVRSRTPPRPCVECGRSYKPTRRGLCVACYERARRNRNRREGGPDA